MIESPIHQKDILNINVPDNKSQNRQVKKLQNFNKFINLPS